jgi:hypothetical protein
VGTVVKNNLLHADVGGGIFFYDTDPAQQSVHGNWLESASGGYFAPVLPPDNLLSAADPLFVNVGAPETVASIEAFDFHLPPGSPAVDRGVFLTSTVGAGSGTSLAVEDASYFIDGCGIADGDLVQLQGQTQSARVLGVDYAASRLTLDRPLSWSDGQGVSLGYTGAAPDIGAFER